MFLLVVGLGRDLADTGCFMSCSIIHLMGGASLETELFIIKLWSGVALHSILY